MAASPCRCSPAGRRAAGVAGLEFFVGIPGRVGGAVRMNAGGHGAQTGEVILGARVFDLADGRARDLERRSSSGSATARRRFAARESCSAATFAGHADDPAASRRGSTRSCGGDASISPAVRTRDRCSPTRAGDSAGRLIDAAGLQGRAGRRRGRVREARQLLRRRARRARRDVYELMDLVRRRVHESTGVLLEPELHLVGFEPLAHEWTDAEAS